MKRTVPKFGGSHSTVDSILASHPMDPGLNPAFPKFFRGKFEVAEVNQQLC